MVLFSCGCAKEEENMNELRLGVNGSVYFKADAKTSKEAVTAFVQAAMKAGINIAFVDLSGPVPTNEHGQIVE